MSQTFQDLVRAAIGTDVPDSQIQTNHIRLRDTGVSWSDTNVQLNEGPVLAQIHENCPRRGTKLSADVAAGTMEVKVNIESGELIGTNKTVTLHPPRDYLPAIDINIGKLSHTYRQQGQYKPQLLRTGKSIKLRNTEYSGDFILQVRVSGRIPYGGDQIDASHLSDDGGYFTREVRGNCQYKIVY